MNFSSDLKWFFPSQSQQKIFEEMFQVGKNPWAIEKNFYKKCEKYFKYILWIPGLRMIWVGNTIAMNCAKKSSDIDLYIVSTPKRLWIVRILVTFVFQILRVRKDDTHHAGRFCLSFFSTTNALDFKNFALDKDIYLYNWIVHFKPIVNINNTYEDFISQNNSWADFLEYKKNISENKKYIKFSRNFPEKNNSKIWNFIEKILKKIFLPKTLKHYKKIWKPYGIIISDDMLKFHNGDIRKQTRNKII